MTSRDAAPTAPAFFMPAQTVTMTASSIRERILNRIHTVTLPGITGVGSRIYRSRSQAYSRSEAPAISISPGNDDPRGAQNTIGASLGKLDNALAVLIEVYVRGDIPDQLADPIGVQIHQRMMADRTMGGLAKDVQPDGWRPQYELADLTAGWFGFQFLVKYRTQDSDISVAP
jgi:hypothetical protein